ncbi:MAG: beta strand repeat-containing protein [Candidatus Acidiferrales bacterium]
MKMRGSSAKIGAYIAATLFIPGLLLFAFVHMEGHGTRTVAEQTLGSVNTQKTRPDIIRAEMAEAYGKLPLAFEKNIGQSNPQVQYLSHGQGYEIFLTPQEAVLSLRHAKAIGVSPSNRIAYERAVREANRAAKTSVVRMQFAGANPAAEITGLNKLARKTDYFTGNNPKDWRTDVPSYSRVEYRGIYPGVDAVFYGNQSRLEYDFVVAPGANPRAIALNVEGARKLRVDAHGNLVMNLAEGTIELEKPVVYQTVRGERREVAGNYVVRGDDRVAFDVSRYNPSQPLIIDPVLDYSTYLGGSSLGDFAQGIAVDANGDAFITGQTFNATFPVGTGTIGFDSNSPDGNIATNGAAFVSELDPTGTQELYFSYLSGNGGEVGLGIAVDPSPNTTCMNGGNPGYCVYVTGQTFSTNYPVNSVITPYNAGPGGGGDAFVTKLNPYASGNSSLLYSSYLASDGAGDVGNGIAVDASQDAYITGMALASPGAPPNFPILNGAQTTLGSANGNAFLTVINTTASSNALVYSSYLGGDDAKFSSSGFGSGDYGFGVAVDSNKIAYIVGVTVSSNFPDFKSTATYPNIKGFAGPPAGNTYGAAFVSAINTTATNGSASLIYSTYLGGTTTLYDYGTAIALGANGIVYVTGQTRSSNFTVTQAGTSVGQFPSPAASSGVAFVTELNTTQTGQPVYSVLLGGNNGDTGNGIRVDGQGNVIVVGATSSPDFPVTPGAFKASFGTASGDAFIAKIKPAGTGSSDLLYSTYFGGSGQPNLPDQAQGVAVDPLGNAYVTGVTYSSDLPLAPNPGAFQATMPGGAASAGFVAKLTLQPTLAVSPLSIAFGNQGITQMSAAQIVTLTNNTDSAIGLTIPLPALTGTNPGDFVAAPAASGSIAACTTSLSAGNSCDIGVTFTPSLTAADSATLNISFTYNNGVVPSASGSESVGLSGTGVVAAAGATVMPASPLTFNGQLVTTTSSAQTVTVTNSGNASLTFSAAPSISGMNSTDFTIASGTTCSVSTPVTAGNSCIVNVTFAPPAGAAGARSAVLTMADNASGSSQTEALAGTAWDFSLSAQSATVGSNGAASVPVTVTGIGGFAGPVTLSCSASIPHGTCTAPATPVTATGTANVTITTNAFVVPSTPGQTPPISPLQIVLCLLGVTLLSLFPIARAARTRLGLAGVAVLFVVLAGCANTPPTSAGQYTVTITGTSGSVSHQTTATVTVK